MHMCCARIRPNARGLKRARVIVCKMLPSFNLLHWLQNSCLDTALNSTVPQFGPGVVPMVLHTSYITSGCCCPSTEQARSKFKHCSAEYADHADGAGRSLLMMWTMICPTPDKIQSSNQCTCVWKCLCMYFKVSTAAYYTKVNSIVHTCPKGHGPSRRSHSAFMGSCICLGRVMLLATSPQAQLQSKGSGSTARHRRDRSTDGAALDVQHRLKVCQPVLQHIMVARQALILRANAHTLIHERLRLHCHLRRYLFRLRLLKLRVAMR